MQSMKDERVLRVVIGKLSGIHYTVMRYIALLKQKLVVARPICEGLIALQDMLLVIDILLRLYSRNYSSL
jgi:hypothetical protein